MKKTTLISVFVFFLSSLCFSQNSTLFPISENGKTGYIDNTGKVLIKPQFDAGRDFSEGFAPVLFGEDWGYIDETGKIVIKPQFFQISGFSDGIASVGVYFENRKIIKSKIGYYSYINKSGKLITKQKFGVAFGFSEGLAQVLTEDYKHGIIDKTGNIIFYFDIYNNQFSEGFAMFKTRGNMPDSRTGFIDNTGKITIEAKFESGEDFSEGLACVYSDKGAGYIDTKGNVVIDFKFKYCRSFSEGLAAVYIDDKWGYIDKKGNFIIKPQFAEVKPFSDNVAVVRVIENSKTSKTIDNEKRFKQGDNIIEVKEGSFGVIDKTGKLILPAKFTQIGSFSNGLAWVNLSDNYIVHGDTESWGYINKKGKIVWKSF